MRKIRFSLSWVVVFSIIIFIGCEKSVKNDENPKVGPVDAAKSTVSANPTTVIADGSAASTITVTLKDVNNNPVSGKTITLTKSGGASTISAASGPSTSSGVVTFAVKDTVAEVTTYMASDSTDGIIIIQTATVTFTKEEIPPSKTYYSLNFSTYFGGNGFEHARDICVDSQGNIFVVGGTNSDNFPTTPNAYDRTFDNTGNQIGSAGYMDAFIAKFNGSGQPIWSTYLGGPNYDRAYGIEVDSQGYVYVAGRAGPGFPTTANAFQPSFEGVNNGIYGMQNGFVAKLSPDGNNLVWASYVGAGTLCRDLAIDDNGDVYVPLSYEGGGIPPSSWFANAFQKSLKGGLEEGVVKIRGDGTQVIWATWLGGSGDDGGAASIRVDNNKYVYIVFNTRSTDIPTTAGGYDRTYNGGEDFYVAKLTPDGSNLVFATYLGGSGNEVVNTHNLALDNAGNAYVSPWTNSTDFPTTPNAFQKQPGGGTSDIAVAKFSPTGALLASTYIGGSGLDNADGICADSSGNVYLTGDTSSNNFPVTNNAYQTSNKGGSEAVLFMLSSDLTQLLYSTYMGGVSDDMGRSGFLDKDGNLYVAGSTSGGGWPTKNAYQADFQGGQLDVIIAKFLKSTTN